MDAGEHVEERALPGRREPHAVGGDHRHAKGAGQLGQRLVVAFLVAEQMALQLHAHVVAAEQADETIEQAADAVTPRVEHRPAGQRDETGA